MISIDWRKEVSALSTGPICFVDPAIIRSFLVLRDGVQPVLLGLSGQPKEA
jgi:hypothetical protein